RAACDQKHSPGKRDAQRVDHRSAIIRSVHRIADGRPGTGPSLLVSVSTAEEARDALEGGADIIDAKDPHAGALGPVTLDTLAAIHRVVGRTRLLTAALGDIEEGSGLRALGSGTEIESLAYAYASA